MKKKEKTELLKQELIYQAIESEILSPTLKLLINQADNLLSTQHHINEHTVCLFKKLIDYLERTKSMESICLELSVSSYPDAIINSMKMAKVFANRKAQLSMKIRILRPIILNCIMESTSLETKVLLDSELYGRYLKRSEDFMFESIKG